MLLFYIRHGDPIYDPDSLTPLGQEQAKALAKRLIVHGVDKVYSSPSGRARMTAQPLCDLLKKEINICPWADEALAAQDFMIIREDTGYNWSFFDPELVALFNSPEVFALGKKWYEHPAFDKYNFAKGVKRVNEAVDNFFLELGFRHDRENNRYEVVTPNHSRVALFAHQGFAMSFFSSMLDIPYPQFSTHYDFSHSSLSVIQFTEMGGYVYPKVLQSSGDSHLYREGLLTGYNNGIKF